MARLAGIFLRRNLCRLVSESGNLFWCLKETVQTKPLRKLSSVLHHAEGVRNGKKALAGDECEV